MVLTFYSSIIQPISGCRRTKDMLAYLSLSLIDFKYSLFFLGGEGGYSNFLQELNTQLAFWIWDNKNVNSLQRAYWASKMM